MKKKFTRAAALLTLLFLGLAPEKSNAQFTGIHLLFTDSTAAPCRIPSGRQVYVYGSYTGTPATGDWINITFNFGDGNIITTPASVFNGNFTASGINDYVSAGTFITRITAETSNGLVDTVYSDPLVLTNDCAAIKGSLFLDFNNNCTYDAGEQAISWRTVSFTNTATNAVTYTVADAAGHYETDLPNGYTYTVQPNVSSYGQIPTCPSSGTASVTLSGGPSVTKDFAYKCDSSSTDLSVQGFITSFRRSGTRWLSVNAFSTNACLPVPATITLTLNSPELHYNGAYSGSAPSSVSGNVITWNTTLSYANAFNAALEIFCDSALNIGDSACYSLAISTTALTETNLANNSAGYCAPVNNSYDPNEKNVWPREGLRGFIPSASTTLNYRIDFQNTGNDVAYNVTIKDLLDQDLDPKTFRVLSASHPVKVSVTDNQELVFRFDNIMLPDSNANEPASHGHVIYAIDSRGGLAAGTEITNTARIYFDFNDPIITNTTLNTVNIPTIIVDREKGAFTAAIYPNPANNTLQIKASERIPIKITMTDLLGRSVTGAESKDGHVLIYTQSLPAGLYMITVSGNNSTLSGKVLIQH